MSQTERPPSADDPANEAFDPLDPDYPAGPYPYYARFRRESPIFYAPEIDFWVVSRYGAIQESLISYPEEDAEGGGPLKPDLRTD